MDLVSLFIISLNFSEGCTVYPGGELEKTYQTIPKIHLVQLKKDFFWGGGYSQSLGLQKKKNNNHEIT